MKTTLFLIIIAVMLTGVGCKDEIQAPTNSTDSYRIVYTKFDGADQFAASHAITLDSNGGDLKDYGVGAVIDAAGSKMLLAFGDANSGNITSLVVCDKDGNNRQTIDTLALGASDIGIPSLSPDGTKIAYTIADKNERCGLYIINADGSNRHLVAQHISPQLRMTFSPNSSLIAYYTDTSTSGNVPLDGTLEIATVDGSSKYTAATIDNLKGDYQSTIAWSTTGKIAYHDGTTITIMNADGSNKHPVSVGVGQAWSSDGSTLAYAIQNGVVTTADEGLTIESYPMTDLQSCDNVKWSPDNKRIIYESWNGPEKDFATQTVRELNIADKSVKVIAIGGVVPNYVK